MLSRKLILAINLILTIFFISTEQSSSYMKQEKFHEAYGMLDCLHKYGHEIHFVPVLVNYYISLMHTNQKEQADKIKDELITLLTDKFDESSLSFNKYAFCLLRKKKLLEALLFFQVAVYFIGIEKDVEMAMVEPQQCCYGMSQLTKALLQDCSFGRKLITDVIIPNMKKCKDHVTNAFSMNLKLSSLGQASCFRYMAFCYDEMKNFEDAEKYFQKAIDVMKKFLKEDVADFKLYGNLLKELADVLLSQDKAEESLNMMKSSLAAIKKAKDFGSSPEKLLYIKKYQQAVDAATFRET